MANLETDPVKDSVTKVDDEVAVGEDLTFQHKWWKFERAIWILFLLILVLDLSGAFGRGPLAHAHAETPDGMLQLKYDRIERTGTPSMLDVSFGERAIREGKLRLYVDDAVVKELGAQRVVPQPAVTEVGAGGLTYTFPASVSPALVRIELEPTSPGLYRFSMGVPGGASAERRVLVMP